MPNLLQTSQPTLPPEAALQDALRTMDWGRLVRESKKLLRKKPSHHWAHRYLGFALHKSRRDEDALAAFDRALAYWPNDADILLNQSQTLIELGQQWRAVPMLEKLVALRPDGYLVWLKLSQALYRVQGHSRGWECALKCEELASNDHERASALTQKAIHRRELGQVKEAVADCLAVLALNPDDLTAHTNRLLFMLADPDVTALDIKQAALAYAQVAEVPQKSRWPLRDANERMPWSRLRIGFLSPDFRNHSVMYFVEGLLAQLDRRQFAVVALHLNAGGDQVTERVRKHADEFIDLANFTFHEQRRKVDEAQLDVLIDLAGHTGNNGLVLVAGKPAPLQVSWLGYPATTGLESVDYKFTDEVTDPDGADVQYTERLFRMPTLFCCYRPHTRNPLWRYQPAYEVQPSPALRKGHVTFGSCNNLGKLTDSVLSLWAEILNKVPNSRLLIEGKNLDNPEFHASYTTRCERLGIPLDQLDLVPLDVRNQYLTYHDIDIALDPFPLTGGTTTFDVLWMGVPLVSMEGADFKSRLSTGMLTYLGRTDWLARSPEEYIACAVSLAADVEKLNTQRMVQRDWVEQSPLMNESLFVREFSNGLRVIWLEWLAKARFPDDPHARQAWMQDCVCNMPTEWADPAEPGVGLGTGQRISQKQAHELLNKALDKAKRVATEGETLTQTRWREVTELAETVLSAIPHDPVALSCLAEVEHAHGHTEFAVTYLKHMVKAMKSAEASA